MIHDAQVEVTCDEEDCNESVYVYNGSDREIEKSLVQDHGWIVEDGKHFCEG